MIRSLIIELVCIVAGFVLFGVALVLVAIT